MDGAPLVRDFSWSFAGRPLAGICSAYSGGLSMPRAIDAFLTEVALQLPYTSISDLMLEEIKVLEKHGGKWWFGGDLNFLTAQ